MSIGIIILFIALIPALWRRSGTFALLWLLGSGLMAFEYMQVLFSWSVQDYIVSFPLPIGEANIGLNRLSAFFGVIFSLGLPLGILYGHYYLKAHTPGHLRTHLVALGVLGLSMHGVLWMRHGLLFVLVWELMSISSFLCIIYDGKSSFKAALNYLITMQIGAAFLMAAFALLYYQTGSFDFDNLYNMPRLPHGFACRPRGVAVKGVGADLDLEVFNGILQFVHLVLRKRLGRKEVQGPGLGILHQRVQHGHVVAQRLTRGRRGHDADILTGKNCLERFPLMGVEALHAPPLQALNQFRIQRPGKPGTPRRLRRNSAPRRQTLREIGVRAEPVNGLCNIHGSGCGLP